MANRSPYRALDGATGPGTTLYFLPQLRIYALPIVALLGGLVLLVAPAPIYVGHAICGSELDPSSGKVLHAGCAFEGPRLEVNPERYALEPSGSCASITTELETLLEPVALQRLEVRSEYDRKAITAVEARAAIHHCLPSAAPEGGSWTLPASVRPESRRMWLTFQVHDLRWLWLGAVLYLFALLALGPSRVIRVRIDPATRAVFVRDFALYRRARATDCMLDEIEDVILDDGRIAFRSKTGATVRFSDTDRRPIELKNRTVARLRGFIDAARDRPVAR